MQKNMTIPETIFQTISYETYDYLYYLRVVDKFSKINSMVSETYGL